MTNLARLGSLIRTARKETGLTLKQLGEVAGVNFADLSKIERGKMNTSVETLEKILKPLGKRVTIE